jgi:hypothetical protein
LTDVATNHQVTNQQPNDYKEPIKKSEDKVKSYNNKINKHMSSKKQVKVIYGKDLPTLPSTENSSVNQLADISTMDTSQSKGRESTYCTNHS